MILREYGPTLKVFYERMWYICDEKSRLLYDNDFLMQSRLILYGFGFADACSYKNIIDNVTYLVHSLESSYSMAQDYKTSLRTLNDWGVCARTLNIYVNI